MTGSCKVNEGPSVAGFIPTHSSGHIYIAHFISFVMAVGPRTLIPVHTFEPQAFRNHFENVQLLGDGQPVDL